MGQRFPEDDFFAKLLVKDAQTASQVAERKILILTLLIFGSLSCSAIFMDFTATRCPMYVPVLTSANPPEANILSETSISSVIIMDPGNTPWVPASLLNVTKKSRFSVALRFCSTMPWRPKRLNREIGTYRDLRGTKSRCIARHLCAPGPRQTSSPPHPEGPQPGFGRLCLRR